MADERTPEEWNRFLHETHAHGQLKLIHWLMNFGEIIASQAALMAAHEIMTPPQAARQVRIIHELLATDPNTGAVLISLDRLLALLEPPNAPQSPPAGEIVPADVLERLRAMKRDRDG